MATEAMEGGMMGSKVRGEGYYKQYFNMSKEEFMTEIKKSADKLEWIKWNNLPKKYQHQLKTIKDSLSLSIYDLRKREYHINYKVGRVVQARMIEDIK